MILSAATFNYSKGVWVVGTQFMRFENYTIGEMIDYLEICVVFILQFFNQI